MSAPADVRWDDRGLVPAVAQDARTGQVRMVAFMDAAALRRTIETGEAHFFSRSRGALWKKGETSGNVLRVVELRLDCDADAVLLRVAPAGPTCHTGRPSCFFRSADGAELAAPAGAEAAVLSDLFAIVLERRRQEGRRSYVRALLAGGADAIGAKLREEADELARAVAGESPARVAAEAADLLFHLLVGLAARDVDLAEVFAELRRREGVSGLDEKAARDRRDG